MTRDQLIAEIQKIVSTIPATSGTPGEWVAAIQKALEQTFRAILETDEAAYRESLIKVAALAVKASEALEIEEDQTIRHVQDID